MKNSGLVHLYCGDGKGKTTAAVGLAVRHSGRGGKVVFAQFLKDGTSASAACSRARRDRPRGRTRSAMFSFRWNRGEKAETAAALGRTFDAATGFAVRERATLLVLDEICAAVNCGFLPEKTLTEFLESRPDSLEVVLTGRDPSENLQVHADYITEMKKRRHPFDEGVAAREGIEF